jgi:membrane protease YdiL (CAAX protease family)
VKCSNFNNVLQKQKFLYIYAFVIVVIMLILFPKLTKELGKTAGYISSYAAYLILIAAGIIIIRPQLKSKALIKCPHAKLYHCIAFIPAAATLFAAFIPIAKDLSVAAAGISVVYAILNGTLEELFWRGCFNSEFSDSVIFAYLLPTVIFSCWHIALALAEGMNYSGGNLALIGGAGFMGLLWGLVAYKTKNIKVVICTHVLTNFFAFSQLVHQNWFAH